MPRVADPLSEIDNLLHEGTTWGDNLTGKVLSPNEGLEVTQMTGSLEDQQASIKWALCSLSSGRLAAIRTESSVIS